MFTLSMFLTRGVSEADPDYYFPRFICWAFAGFMDWSAIHALLGQLTGCAV